MPSDDFEVSIDDEGKIIDFLSDRLLEPRPEEFVRQKYLRVLHFEYQYPKDVLAREIPIRYGCQDQVDSQGNPIRADIVIYANRIACANRDQGQIFLIVECKAPTQDEGYNQLVSYIYNTSAQGGIWYNGTTIAYYRRLETPNNQLLEWINIPRRQEAWDALGRRAKSQQRRPRDIKGLLKLCHNRLHGRGSDSDEEDLTMDMVRLILCKAQDEESPGDLPEFYCTPEEYRSAEGQAAVVERITRLFAAVKTANSEVFAQEERISVGPRAICDVVTELQDYKLLSNLASSEDWDIMGLAYEEYTSTYLKRKKGQFFTNRLVIDLLVGIVNPTYTDVILDPAGGSGGFLTGAMRYIRRKILDQSSESIPRERQLSRLQNNLFMVEINKRLVKVAKTAMILNGDGHTGMTNGDSLGPYSQFNETILSKCRKGQPTVIFTNPPFAGVGEGRITDQNTLARFDCGKHWIEENGNYVKTEELVTEGVPPEMLFFERCVDWLAPGGRLGIVLPKSFLDTQTYRPARQTLFNKCKLLVVINNHKNTFQPHTGVRTCLVVVQKLPSGENPLTDYPIFMAISRNIGQDSEGKPIFIRDDVNGLTDEIDQDLSDILSDYEKYKQGNLIESEYRFAINRNQVNNLLAINPQAFLPALNETLRNVESIDNVPGWSVIPLSQIEDGVKIFKGPRFKSENIICEKKETSSIESYYTPSAVLQEKCDSVKFVDVSKANASQLRTINAIRVKRGDIVITRSGSIGRVEYITQKFHDAIVSDDLIRVRIIDENSRFYAYSFLMTKYANDQMMKNEYGAIQQHLEPQHVRNIMIPIPDDWSQISSLIDKTRELVNAKEALHRIGEESSAMATTNIDTLVTRAVEETTQDSSE